MNTINDIETNGIRLRVEDQGQGGPALVFLHYWGGSARSWSAITSALSPDMRCIAIDQRGWGGSDAPETGYDLSTQADDIQGVIHQLKLREYVLIGHSMGGKVAQLLASRQPKGLLGLVLVAPSPPSPLNLPIDVRQGMVTAYASRESILATVRQVLAATPLGAETLEQIVADSLAGSASAKAAWPLATSQEDISGAIASINVPTVVISGELDRVDPPAVLEEALLPHIPQARLHILPGIGHLLPLEAPRELETLIREFIPAFMPTA